MGLAAPPQEPHLRSQPFGPRPCPDIGGLAPANMMDRVRVVADSGDAVFHRDRATTEVDGVVSTAGGQYRHAAAVAWAAALRRRERGERECAAGAEAGAQSPRSVALSQPETGANRSAAEAGRPTEGRQRETGRRGAVFSNLLLLLLKSVEFNDDVALLLSVAGLVVGPHVTSESEIGGTDSAALRTSWTCLRLT